MFGADRYSTFIVNFKFDASKTSKEVVTANQQFYTSVYHDGAMSRLACFLAMGVELIEHVTSVLATAPKLLFLFSVKKFVLKRVFATWLNTTSSQIVLLLYA